MAKPKKPTAPPTKSTFQQALFDQVCELMTEGATAREACRKLEIKWGTFCSWKRGNAELLSQYARAREDLFDYWADEIISDASDESRDLQPDGKGGIKSDNTAVNRDRLKIESKKWLLSKLKPDQYGDLQKLEHSGSVTLAPVINYKPKTG